MRVALLAFSDRGFALGERLVSFVTQSGDSAALTRCAPGALGDWTQAHFGYDALIFIGSCGIAVRAVAPYVVSKVSDPAVLAADEGGGFVVSLLSGHLGGANRLTERLARFLGAVPVVTTATDVRGVFAVDTWAAEQGLRVVNPARIKEISARLLAGERVTLSGGEAVAGPLPPGIRLCDGEGDVLITWRRPDSERPLVLAPPVLTLGVGCRRGVSAEALERAFLQTLEREGLLPQAVSRACSIGLKAGEPGLLAFCRARNLPLNTFSVQELEAVPGVFTASPFVREITGVDNVCQRAAVLGSGPGGRLLGERYSGGGVTMALALSSHPITFSEEEQR